MKKKNNPSEKGHGLLKKRVVFQKQTNPSEKGHGLFYSAGRAIVSRDGQTTQICCPTAQKTQKPPPTKESTKVGRRRRRPPPFVVSSVGVSFCVFWAIGLHICVVGASLETIALPAE